MSRSMSREQPRHAMGIGEKQTAFVVVVVVFGYDPAGGRDEEVGEMHSGRTRGRIERTLPEESGEEALSHEAP